LDVARLLGRADVRSHAEEPRAPGLVREALVGDGLPEHERVTVELPASEAADIAARLRGLGLDGRALVVTCVPPLGRTLVREARLREARARRETTPGFVRPGARATGEGRYSLTPEALALELGQLARGASVVDACCGSGGNAIGFARAGCAVTALELDPGRLAEARHNAALYGVSERISFQLADAREVVAKQRADVLFVDPPWGEAYDKRASSLADFPLLSALLASDLGAYGELWLKLPSSFAVASIEGASASAWFGRERGDAQRVKFVLLRVPSAPAG
jgi:trimethylguanosine synthase